MILHIYYGCTNNLDVLFRWSKEGANGFMERLCRPGKRGPTVPCRRFPSYRQPLLCLVAPLSSAADLAAGLPDGLARPAPEVEPTQEKGPDFLRRATLAGNLDPRMCAPAWTIVFGPVTNAERLFRGAMLRIACPPGREGRSACKTGRLGTRAGECMQNRPASLAPSRESCG